MTEKIKWHIWVSGYGAFDFDGTETEAEEMRKHKGKWEGGASYKWRADLSRESDRLTDELVGMWERGAGVPQSLLRKRKAALMAEV